MFPSSAAPSLQVGTDSADTVGVSSPERGMFTGKEWTQSDMFALGDERMETVADEPFLEMLSRQLTELEALVPNSNENCIQDKNGNYAMGPFDTPSQQPEKRKRKRSSSESLMKQMMERQEAMHWQLMEVLERRENDRIIREEAWRKQQIEMARRDSRAIMSFIKNISGQQTPIPEPVNIPPTEVDPDEDLCEEKCRSDPGDKRWSKSEVAALIKLRIDMDHKFQNTGRRVPLWEKISKTMSSLGYKRSGTKCRDKWHNINCYFKRAKHQPQDSKRCPYFGELELLYNQQKPNGNDQCEDGSDHLGTNEAVNSVASSSTSLMVG